MSAPTVVQWAGAATTAGAQTSVTITLASTPTSGNLLVLLVAFNYAAGALTSGVSSYNEMIATSTSSPGNAIYAKVVSGDTSTLTLGFGGYSDCAAILMEVAGAGSTPGITGATPAYTATTGITSNGITGVTANSLMIWYAAYGLAAATITTPSSGLDTVYGGSVGCTVALYPVVSTTGGSVAGVAWSNAYVGAWFGGIAIAPAAGGVTAALAVTAGAHTFAGSVTTAGPAARTVALSAPDGPQAGIFAASTAAPPNRTAALSVTAGAHTLAASATASGPAARTAAFSGSDGPQAMAASASAAAAGSTLATFAVTAGAHAFAGSVTTAAAPNRTAALSVTAGSHTMAASAVAAAPSGRTVAMSVTDSGQSLSAGVLVGSPRSTTASMVVTAGSHSLVSSINVGGIIYVNSNSPTAIVGQVVVLSTDVDFLDHGVIMSLDPDSQGQIEEL